MSVRHVARRVAVSLAATAAAGTLALAFAPAAGAAGPASGDTVPNAAQAQAPFNAGQPFDSGQFIDVVVPANSIFVSTTAVKIAECSAPNGVVPTQPSACDGNTVATAFPETDGSMDYLNDGTNANGYQVFFLPDSRIGDSPSGPKCGNTLATECVLFIGDDQGNFTLPHVWSQPFLTNPDATDSGTINPGDGTPEVPMAILLPVAALGLLGGVVVIRRRRAARSA